jgi:hypothetical protein
MSEQSVSNTRVYLFRHASFSYKSLCCGSNLISHAMQSRPVTLQGRLVASRRMPLARSSKTRGVTVLIGHWRNAASSGKVKRGQVRFLLFINASSIL